MISLPTSTAPRVSVVIVAWRNDKLLARCLRSLAEHLPAHIPAEVLVTLNGAIPEVETVVRGAQGLRVFGSAVNLGFAGGSNRAARHAEGEFIVLLNDDAEIEPGWLEGLVETADMCADAAAVGSRVLWPDGRLQEAGVVLWSDATTHSVGNGAPRDSRDYMYAREVDYCSASSLLVRADAWRAVGGLDDAFFPAYFEDADLCLAIRKSGGRVLYSPASRVRHHEAASSDPLYKTFLFFRNRRRFQTKWATELSSQPSPDSRSRDAVRAAVMNARGGPRNVLVAGSNLPPTLRPDSDTATRAILNDLTLAGWAITFVPSDGSGLDPLALGRAGIELLDKPLSRHLRRGGADYDVALVTDGRLRAEIGRRRPRAAILSERELEELPDGPASWARTFARMVEDAPDG